MDLVTEYSDLTRSSELTYHRKPLSDVRQDIKAGFSNTDELDDFDRSILQHGYVETVQDRVAASPTSSEIPQKYLFSPGLPGGPSLAPGLQIAERENEYACLTRFDQACSSAPLYGQSQCTMTSNRIAAQTLSLGHAPPIVQGIDLIFANALPDRFRSIFPFNPFNAVQSKCFSTVYGTNDNLVVAAPTGSGKTVILELAICRLLATFGSDQYKVIYQAPTKALCAERHRDWEAKFATLDVRCAALTGDTDQAQIKNIQNASVIITTPEKWDSMTRKWKDRAKLMQLVKLFLIDEVHMLKDTRGATLEAVVSRMKGMSSNLRFVALSATVPNVGDVARWLGKNGNEPQLPARQEKFGEEFRPVKLQKYVYGYKSSANEFALDKLCESKLPEVIIKHSSRKPIMVFCCTRSSAISTAKFLAKWWEGRDPQNRQWVRPTQRPSLQNNELRTCALSGVAFHHGGLEIADRTLVEKSYQTGQLSVICCTSTLAVGVNLPCNLVIIKNTVGWQAGGLREYADLEIMQMLGRAGRPQFDKSATAVIMTRTEKMKRYEAMVSGQEALESCLHANLIEHLNAEIGLGSILDIYTAKLWLKGTFLYVRLTQNPNYYGLDCDASEADTDEKLEDICARDIGFLQEARLVSDGQRLRCTEYGDAMARYYVKFETMKNFLTLKPQAKMSEILQSLAQAEEFKDIRLKAAERGLYRTVNKATGIRFPINVDLALPAHKISLLLQAELGGVEFPPDEQYQKHRQQYQQDRSLIFQHLSRLIRCLIDCKITDTDSVSVRHGLELVRSFAAHAWDDSPLQLKQIDQLGGVAARKLAAVGICDVDALGSLESRRIETILSRRPPFGSKILAKVKQFPKLKVTAILVGNDVKAGHSVQVKVRAEIRFTSDQPPTMFRGKPLFICFLAETSDGRLLEFGRLSASKARLGEKIDFLAPLSSASQYISFCAMCEEIAGSSRQVDLKPDVPSHLFPALPKALAPSVLTATELHRSTALDLEQPKLTKSCMIRQAQGGDVDDFDDADLEDIDFQGACDLGYDHIDDFEASSVSQTLLTTPARHRVATRSEALVPKSSARGQLKSGRWECNHKCKDKSMCKHLCCREGLDKPPKNSKESRSSIPHCDQQQRLSLNRDAGALAHKLARDAEHAGRRTGGEGSIVEIVNLAKAGRETGEEIEPIAGTRFLPSSSQCLPENISDSAAELENPRYLNTNQTSSGYLIPTRTEQPLTLRNIIVGCADSRPSRRSSPLTGAIEGESKDKPADDPLIYQDPSDSGENLSGLHNSSLKWSSPLTSSHPGFQGSNFSNQRPSVRSRFVASGFPGCWSNSPTRQDLAEGRGSGSSDSFLFLASSGVEATVKNLQSSDDVGSCKRRFETFQEDNQENQTPKRQELSLGTARSLGRTDINEVSSQLPMEGDALDMSWPSQPAVVIGEVDSDILAEFGDLVDFH